MNEQVEGKKKVAIVYPYFAHYRLPVIKTFINSGEYQCTLLSDKQSGNNIKIFNEDQLRSECPDIAFDWVYLKNIWIIKIFLYQIGLLRHLISNSYSAVIFLGNIYYLNTWIGVIYLRLFKPTKILLWTHGVTNRHKDIKWFIRKFFYSLAHKLLLYGVKAKNFMVSNGVNESKIEVIFNSLDYEKQLEYRKNSSFSYDFRNEFKITPLPVVFFIGRLTRQKNLKMIIDAVTMLIREGFFLNCLFIGDGAEKEYLYNQTIKSGFEKHFHFYGACYDEEIIANLIGSADLCLSPGEVGLTAITSLGYGTPVITHDLFDKQMPEYESIIPGYNGDLFEYNNVHDFKRSIKEWLIESSVIGRDLIRQRCYQQIDENYNPITQVAIINRLLNELTSND